MFTGLVQATASLKNITPLPEGKRFCVAWPTMPNDIVLGESIAIDGACMTVTAFDTDSFEVEASSETLALTLMAYYQEGQQVNLERALSFQDKLGGHFVTGHVDGLGKVVEKTEDGIAWRYTFELTDTAIESVKPCLVAKGGISVNGVSLTINTVVQNQFSVAIIPFTYEHTNIGQLVVGSFVNLEGDLLGKYVNRHLSALLSSEEASSAQAALKALLPQLGV